MINDTIISVSTIHYIESQHQTAEEMSTTMWYGFCMRVPPLKMEKHTRKVTVRGKEGTLPQTRAVIC